MNLPFHEFDESLLTAYLDNEVTEAERVLVEQQLERSEAARKLLEELQSVRAMVRQLHLQSPAKSFSKGPWSGAADAELKNAAVGGADLPKVTLVNPSSSTHWNWQQWASLAALLLIGLGVGGLWLSNQSYSPQGPISYRSSEFDLKERDNGRLAPSTRLDESFGFVPGSGTNGPIASSNSLDGVRDDVKSDLSNNDEVSVGSKQSETEDTALEMKSKVEPPAMPKALGLDRSTGDSSSGMGGLGGAGNALQQESSPRGAGALRGAPSSDNLAMSPPVSDALPLPAIAPTAPAQTDPGQVLAPSEPGKDNSTQWWDRRDAPDLSPSQQSIVDYLISKAIDEKLDRKSVEGEAGAVDTTQAFLFIDSKPSESVGTIESALIFRFKQIASTEAADEKVKEGNGADLSLGRRPIVQYEEAGVGQTADKAFSVPPIDKYNPSSGVASNTDLVEFQVHKADWSAGAVQLQKLGIPVPTEIPSDAVLNFDASPLSTDGRSAAEKKLPDAAKAEAATEDEMKPATQKWQFHFRLPDRKLQEQVARGQVIEDSPSKPAAAQKNAVQTDDLIRVRVFLKTE